MTNTFSPQKQFCKGELLYVVLALLFIPSAESSVRALQTPVICAAESDQLLEPGTPVRRQIAEGQLHSIRVRSTSRQFVRVLMLEWGLTAEVSIYDPKGRLIAALRSRSEGPTPISWITSVDGIYRVEIRDLNGDGGYEIKIDQLRTSTMPDRGRVAAERAYAEGERLKAEETAESLRNAIKKYEDAALISHAVPDLREEAAARNRIGDLYQILNPSQAFNYYQQALELSRRAKDTSGAAEALNNLGYLHFFLGRTQQALSAAEEALDLSRQAGDRRLQAQSLSVLGEAHYGLGDMEEALAYQNQALALWRDLQDRRGQAQSLVACGYAYGQMSKSRDAIDSFNKAFSLWRAVHSARGEAATLIALGNIQNKLGEKQEALNLFFQAKRLLDPIGDTSYKAYVHAHLARLYRDMGENKLALENNNRAVELFRASGNRWGEAEGQLGIGRIYSTLTEYRTALIYYHDALDTFRSLGMTRLQAQTFRDIGKAYDALGDRVAALDYCRRALEAFRAGQDQRERANTLNYMGAVYEKLSDEPRALDYYTQALTLYRSISDQQGEAASLYNLAHLDRACGEFDAAREKIELAIQLSEALRSKVVSQDLRASFLASAHQQYELYIDVLMKLHEQFPARHYDLKALEVSERGRARSLLESLAEARAGIRQGIHAQLLQREHELQRQLKAKIDQRIQLAGSKASSQVAAIVDRELNDLTNEYRLLEDEIKVSSPHYAALTQPTPLTLAEIQQLVDDDTMLLVYALGEERSFIWTVRPNSIKSFELPAGKKIEEASRRVYELLTARNQSINGETVIEREARIRRAEADYGDASAVLGHMLLDPVASEFKYKRIVVVADGALQYVPFSALPAPASTQGRERFIPLIVEHEVVSLPSASVLALIRQELRQRQPAPELVAVLADPVFSSEDDRLVGAKKNLRTRPNTSVESDTVAALATRRALENFDNGKSGIARLPFSLREADAIRQAAPTGKAMLAVGFRASRALASSTELAKYRIVHFATHGIINSEQPELSGILLSRFDETGKRQDGFLQLSEIYNLNLPADLVVLSACQTALGKDIRGEGLVGLTRGFMYAGAARVIASLWQVDDAATAQLMGEFYKAMFSEDMSPAKALQTAQARMWQQSRWSSPYYWAAFTVQGEWK